MMKKLLTGLFLALGLSSASAQYNPSVFSEPKEFSTGYTNPYPSAPFITPQMYGAVCNGSTSNATADTAGLQAAINAMLANTKYQTLATGGTCALNSTITINNFPRSVNISLGGVIEGPSFPAAGAWNTATSFFTVGSTGGQQVGIHLHIGWATGLDADVLHIGASGLGNSSFDFQDVQYVNGVAKVSGNTNVVDQVRFLGDGWLGCINPQTNPQCGNFGIYFQPGSGTAQGSFVNTNWISNFNYGGVIEQNTTLFTSYNGGFESNGEWTSQLCLTGISGTFQEGETVTESSAHGILETVVYPWHPNNSCVQVIETKNTSWVSGAAHSNFTTSGTLTGSTSGATATISTILVVNQLFGISPYNPESFDIIKGQPLATVAQDKVWNVYTGGIIGPNLASDDLVYGNGSTFTTCFRGVGLHTTGGTLEFQNCSIDPQLTNFTASGSGIGLGGYDVASPTQQFITAQSVLAGNANVTVPDLTITGAKSTGSGVGGVTIATTRNNASNTAQNITAPALTVRGGSQLLQFDSANSFTTADHCGSLAGSTGCLIIYNPSNVLTYLPVY